jgi:hypothetical protein
MFMVTISLFSNIFQKLVNAVRFGDLQHYKVLRSVGRWLVTNFSGNSVFPFFKDQGVQDP